MKSIPLILQALHDEGVSFAVLLVKWRRDKGMLALKRVANRPKDRIDIEALEKIKRGESPDV